MDWCVFLAEQLVAVVFVHILAVGSCEGDSADYK